MTTYKIVELAGSSGSPLHFQRVSERSRGHPLSRLIKEACAGKAGARFDATRALLAAGSRPVARTLHTGIATKTEANRLVEALREEHNLHLPSRRSVRRPRVHQQLDPGSPFLDPKPEPVYYVYELSRPDTRAVFYVGSKLLRAGLAPEERRVHEHLPEAQALIEERKLVKHHGLDQLANDAPGGQGPPTGDEHWTRKHPERVLRGDKHPARTNPEHRRALVEQCRNLEPAKRARGERHGSAKLSDTQADDLRARFVVGGVSQTELGIKFGISTVQVGRILRGKSRNGKPVLRQHGNSKLTPEQRVEICKRRAAGERGIDLARAFGVSSSLIGYISEEIEIEVELVTSS